MRLASHLSALILAAAATAASSQTPSPAAPVRPAVDGARLAYVMVYVSDMKRAVAFYRDRLGLKVRFVSPEWSEFETGATTLALLPAGRSTPAGTSEVGVTVADLDAFYADRSAAGVQFSGPPKPQHYGAPLTEMRDPDGAVISVGGRTPGPAASSRN